MRCRANIPRARTRPAGGRRRARPRAADPARRADHLTEDGVLIVEVGESEQALAGLLPERAVQLDRVQGRADGQCSWLDRARPRRRTTSASASSAERASDDERAIREYLRQTLPRHHLRRKPRAGDRLRRRRLPAGARDRAGGFPRAISTAARPARTRYTSQRHEADDVEILSGVFEGRTTGTPIALLIRNTDARCKDYDEHRRHVPPRPRRLHLLAEVRHPRSARRRALHRRARPRCASPRR